MIQPTNLAYRHQYVDPESLEGKTNEEIQKQIAVLEKQSNEKINILKSELEKRNSLIRLEEYKLELIEFFNNYFKNYGFIYYRTIKQFFGKDRIIFYTYEIQTHDGKFYLHDFENITKKLCVLLDIKCYYSNGNFYIKEEQFGPYYISDLFAKIAKREFVIRELTL